MEVMFSVALLGWVLGLTGVRGYPDCCVERSVGDEMDVTCRRCRLNTVPQDLPVNVTQLDLTNNELTILQPKSFFTLLNLKTLKLDSNRMRNISLGAFDGLLNLRYLSLRDNNLDSSLGANIFQPLVNLRVLQLNQNRFHIHKAYPVNALSYLTSIEIIFIDIFEQFSFGSAFSGFNNLTTLNLHGIEKCSIRNTTFRGLESLTITHLTLDSKISFIEKDSFSPFRNLTLLHIDSRRTLDIHEVFQALYGLRNRTMEEIRYTDNFLLFDRPVDLTVSDIQFLKSICVKRLYLIRNSLIHIHLQVIGSWTSRNCVEVLDVSANKFSSFGILLVIPLFPNLTHFILTNNIPSRSKRMLYIFNRHKLPEKITFIIPPKLMFLNVSHNNVHDFDNIHFSFKNSLKLFDISYQRKGRFRHPIYGKELTHLEELYVSGMNCYHFRCMDFNGMKNLTKLEAKQSNLKNDFLSVNSKSVFIGLRNLTYVDLSVNHLNEWDSLTFHDQRQSLKVLLISENEINVFPTQALETLEQLEYVDIGNNALTTLTLSDYNVLDKLKQQSTKFLVNLHGNPLLCSCDDLDFLRWAVRTTVLYDKENLRCATPHGDSIRIKYLERNFERFEVDCASFSWLIVSILLLVVMFVLVTLSLVSWRYSAKLRVWCRQPADGEFTHYAFISYSDKDSKWVRDQLTSHLEQEGLSFMCADKDFEPGKDIATNILDAIDSCYKSVFVVSYHFLNCEWTRYAMQVTSGYSFRKGREDMNIIILLDDIELSELPKLLRKNWDNVECLRWPRDDSSLEKCADKNTSMEKAREKVLAKLSKYIRKGNPEIVKPEEDVNDTML
ncbi:LOW QUALITY PROTEIN: toll-like receptor 2 [Pecten maximus]|uniref:LOW QUALITY PROTEIN: toll-like receptor 2 n=1 Tax=Pecten maximus TaxID=6579 RepID=UPI001458E90F|nr:LOW QUALITY PROTEIN: toll-like receptor 2 [Pecten maximus]